jgi:hypothetical protein
MLAEAKLMAWVAIRATTEKLFMALLASASSVKKAVSPSTVGVTMPPEPSRPAVKVRAAR